LRDSAALSVIGRSANSTGDPADIAAGTDGHVLRRAGTGLGFGQVVAAGIADKAVTNEKMRDSSALSVVGRSANSVGVPADIAAGTDGHVLRRSGTAVGFGQIAAAGITNGVIDASKIVAAGLSKYVVNSANFNVAGTDGTNSVFNTTTFAYGGRIFDYTPKSGSNLLVLVWTGIVTLKPNTGASVTQLSGEIQFSTGASSNTPIPGGLTKLLYSGMDFSSTRTFQQRVTAIAAISAGNTTARNYGIGFRTTSTLLIMQIDNTVAREQMFVLEIGA